jgi:hypothetical protein
MMCINTYSLVGEYVLDMHHIFSQQFGEDTGGLGCHLGETSEGRNVMVGGLRDVYVQSIMLR